MTELATVPLRDFDPADELVVVKEGTPDELGRVRPRTLPLVTIAEPGLSPMPEPGPSRFRAWHDFIGLLFGQDWQQSNSGSGALFSSVSIQDGGTGWLQSALGTTATGRTFFGLVATGGLRFGLGAAKFVSRLRIATLSDVTNTWTFRAGFIDSGSAETVDGAFFRYTHSVNGGRFQAVTRNNNSETAVDTGITVNAAQTYILRTHVNAAGTEATFYIDGVLVATITTTIPTAAGRETGAGLFCQRSAGTAALTAAFYDYIEVEQTFTGRE